MDSIRILQLLVLTISSVLKLCICLSGEHVCTRMENHTLTSRESYMEPVLVQTFTWCIQVPPRCPKTRIENRQRYRVKTTVELRTISECCEGYVLQESHGEAEAAPGCIPYCKSCENGFCTAPNVCKCEPGYQGDNCTHECPPGSWGKQCSQECDCALGRSCNTVTGICECPAGWRGPGCRLPCPAGQWGLRCESTCNCGDGSTSCDTVTGNCYPSGKEEEQGWLEGNLFRAIQVSGLVQKGSLTTSTSSETSTTSRTTRTSVSGVDEDEEDEEEEAWSSGLRDESGTKVSRTTEHVEDGTATTVSDLQEESDVYESTLSVAADITESPRTTGFQESSPLQGNIVRTSETPAPITPRISEGLRYKGHENDVASRDKTPPPHPNYVQTVQKEQLPPIPFDVTVLIVVGSIVCLTLMTLAALMVFYLRSKVFEAIPLSIYGGNKNDSPQDKGEPVKTLKITNTSLPPLPTFVNPVFVTNQETALITFDATELNKHYDNRTGTISIRLSGNIRDLLESHYDRPPAATCRHTVDQSTEHVYDEIPLTSPLCVRNDA